MKKIDPIYRILVSDASRFAKGLAVLRHNTPMTDGLCDNPLPKSAVNALQRVKHEIGALLFLQ